MRITKSVLFLFFSLNFFSLLFAQKHHEKYHFGISALVTHTYISQGIIDNEQKWLAAPSIALNFNYILNEKWLVGLHNDIIIESFVVEDETDHSMMFLEREYPVSNLILVTYKLNKSLGIAFGSGVERANGKHFKLIRLGGDYEVELHSKGLGLIFTANYDILVNAYDSFNFGIGINKLI